MREYTTIPNVFRVASLQSANNQLHHGNSTNLNNQSNNANSDNNQANDSHLQQQQQQQQSTAAAVGATGATTTTTTTTTQAIVHTGMINDAAIGAESVAIRVNYPHKLTTIAAIERQQQYQQQQQHTHIHTIPHPHSHPHTHTHTHPHQNEGIIIVEASNRRGLQSPYATLPRGLNGDMHAKPNTSRQQQHEEQRIINTISGSIPSTGFTNAITPLERSGSLASDLNISLTDFSQLNSLDIQDPLNEHHHHSQQQQHQQHQQQQQQQKFYHHDDYPHFQTSRRLSQKAFMELERKNDNGYLWILTPVAAR